MLAWFERLPLLLLGRGGGGWTISCQKLTVHMGSKLLIILLVYVLLVFLILPKVPVHMGINIAYLSTELHCYSWVVAGSVPINYSTCGATYNPDSIKIISSDGDKLTGYCTEMHCSSVLW